MKLFLKGIIGVFLIVGLLGGCGRRTERIQSVDTAMGTVIQTVLYVDTDAEEGKKLSEELREQIVMLEEEVLSARISDSEIGQLNLAAQIGHLPQEGIKLSEELFKELSVIQEVAAKSKGALDITLGEAAALWNLDSAASDPTLFRMPDPKQLKKAVENSGWEKLILRDGKAVLPQGLRLDPGAVGKGIACDRLAGQLQEMESVRAAVISLGGSILTYGEKKDGTAWKVGIVNPFDTSGYLGYLTLQGKWNIATSGDYERFVEVDGVRYHHILNPADGYPARSGLCSVTIFGQSGLLCDALSTACFVLGAEEGIALAESYDVFAVMVTEEGNLIFSRGAKAYFTDEK